MHAITLMPSDLTVARHFLASHHATRGTVKLFSLLTIFRRIALVIRDGGEVNRFSWDAFPVNRANPHKC